MIIFPAVDIKDGKAVRLAQGRSDKATVFSDDPVAMAAHWQEEGARYLHIVDLDGAFAGARVNFSLMVKIRKVLTIPLQIGGGIRDIATAKTYIDAGADRCIIGTMALESPDMFAELCAVLPGKIGVSLDARNGRLQTKGWVADSGLRVDDVLPRLVHAGTAFIVYTDIERDGMQSGINIAALADLAGKSPVPVIAAGGVASLQDIQALYPLTRTSSLQGVISGKALYEGSLDLAAAMSWIATQP